MFRIAAAGRWVRWMALAATAWGCSSFAAPKITEFMADNGSTLADSDGNFGDWIEVHNPDPTPLALAGYALTDSAANPWKWRFPDITLAPGGYLIVFATGNDRRDPAARLHTNFRLAAEGEYLALVAPDGITVVHAFSPSYPPQLRDESFGIDLAAAAPGWTTFRTPTPGSANGTGLRAGPTLVPVTPGSPSPPSPGPMLLEARVQPANDSVASVRVVYRRMYGPETTLTMIDDGTGGDLRAGDGIWTATLPGTAFGAGEMTRWRFAASDASGITTQVPAFRDPLDSERYFGTVPADPAVRTRLPVLHWFTAEFARAGTPGGSRGAVYFDGEFYDNVLFTVHGQSTSGFTKKSYNLDFNRTHRFRWNPSAPRVADIDLLTNWADKSKVRHVLAYEVMRESGVAAHFAFSVRVQLNGAFHSTADLVEDADEIYLERAGLNPDGALYKVYANQLNKDAGDAATRGVEKKTRKTEGNTDLQALINGLDLTGSALERYLYDHLDVPACVNMLAANSVIRNIDMHAKNWYLYRDTGRSGEWAILPWDLDLSHGRIWTSQNTYFDNALYTDGFVETGTSIRLVAHLFAIPSTRAMLYRRIRTLGDRFLQPPSVTGLPEHQRYYERRLAEQSALIDPPDIVPSDATRDFEKWGSWLQGGTTVSYTNSNRAVETMAEAIERWKSEYLPRRRRYIYETQVVGRGGQIPLAQNISPATTNFMPLVVAGAGAKVLVPANGELGLAWTGDPAREPFATPGWIDGATGVGYERASGYEALIRTDVGTRMQNNNSVFIRVTFDVADPALYDRLELRVKFDDGFAAFLNGSRLTAVNAPEPLQWNSASTASREANASAFTVFDVSSQLGALRPGRNVLAVQGLNDVLTSSDMVIVPELHAGRHVASLTQEPRIEFGAIEARPASGNRDEEYVQLRNPLAIAVDISGWQLGGGIDHTFREGTVLPPRGSLYVSPNVAAFRARSTSPKGGEGLFVQGNYRRHLAGTTGEALILVDAKGVSNNSTNLPALPPDGPPYPADPANDADRNGERDLVDYAMGFGPGKLAVRPRVAWEPGTQGTHAEVVFSYPVGRMSARAELGVVYSRDLQTWEDASPFLELVSRQPLETGRELVTWRIRAPLRDAPTYYLRLRAVPR